MSSRIVFAQKGRRDGLAYPRLWAQTGAHVTLLADCCASSALDFVPGLRWAYGRFDPARLCAGLNDLPMSIHSVLGSPVTACQLYMGRHLGKADGLDRHCFGDRVFGRWAADRLQAGGQANFVAGYSGSSLEFLEAGSKTGAATAVIQVDAAGSNLDILRGEGSRDCLFFGRSGESYHKYLNRLREEWQKSTVVLVNSAHTQQCLITQGVPAHKLIIIPIPFFGEIVSASALEERLNLASGPLKVLYVGSVSILKGFRYLLEAAKGFKAQEVVFSVVGSRSPSCKDIPIPNNVRLLGRKSRNELAEVYRQHDVFVFPSLSDGFGLVQLEAMAAGLPVIASPYCGEVVENGISGYIVEPRKPNDICQAIGSYVDDRKELFKFGRAALDRVLRYTPGAIVSSFPGYRQLLPLINGPESA
ncbi:MAG: glycosyltransferase family 4 protein [Bryobacteraceae bacterium]|nr:glycosyltransferase family 4 protein [Bryobacteraceae bacterium]